MNTDWSRVRLLLPDHHRRLDASCQAVLECAYADDAHGLAMRWRKLEPELLEHLAQEEALILPGYAAFAPDDARRIHAEHTEIGALIAAAGADLSCGEGPCVRLRALVDLLGSHARNEDERMYPWAQQHLPQCSARSLFRRVCHWFGVASTEGRAVVG